MAAKNKDFGSGLDVPDANAWVVAALSGREVAAVPGEG
jgi:hypothetical protein